MTAARPVLLTGGGGRLGTELGQLAPTADWLRPTRAALDITDADAVSDYVVRAGPRLIVHAAAFTDVAGAETARAHCWAVNVTGTRHLLAAARRVGAGFVQVSTDYVFYGDRGNYAETDTPGPVRNYYALTKLVAEEAALAYDRSLVLRTSFRPRQWPYPRAFHDLYTSQDYVDVLAPLLLQVITRFDAGQVPYPVLHVATERKSVLELARRRAPHVQGASKAEAGVPLPDDVSLDTSRWRALRASWR